MAKVSEESPIDSEKDRRCPEIFPRSFENLFIWKELVKAQSVEGGEGGEAEG